MTENLEVVDLETLCEGGLFREKVYREKVSQTDWEQFADKEVLIKGCGNIPIPTWAFMSVAAILAGKAKTVYYGEKAKPILVYPQS